MSAQTLEGYISASAFMSNLRPDSGSTVRLSATQWPQAHYHPDKEQSVQSYGKPLLAEGRYVTIRYPRPGAWPPIQSFAVVEYDAIMASCRRAEAFLCSRRHEYRGVGIIHDSPVRQWYQYSADES
jgi:hypothetical protein